MYQAGKIKENRIIVAVHAIEKASHHGRCIKEKKKTKAQ